MKWLVVVLALMFMSASVKADRLTEGARALGWAIGSQNAMRELGYRDAMESARREEILENQLVLQRQQAEINRRILEGMETQPIEENYASRVKKGTAEVNGWLSAIKDKEPDRYAEIEPYLIKQADQIADNLQPEAWMYTLIFTYLAYFEGKEAVVNEP